MTTQANQWDQTTWRRLTEAAIAYADASDDDAKFMKARDRLRKAAIAYALAHDPKGEIQRRRAMRFKPRTWAVNQLGFWPRTAPIPRATMA